MTPTFAGDFDRFVLLRESIVTFGGGHIKHYALVDTEDEPGLNALNLPGVVTVTTSSLLTPEAEDLRLRYKRSGGRHWKRIKRSMNKRFGWFDDARYFGWQVQQVLKLQAPSVLTEDVFVAFDSDIVVTAPIDASQFVRGECAVLYEREIRIEADKIPNKWFVSACNLLRVPSSVNAGDFVYDYVAQPFVFEKQTCIALQDWLGSHYRQPWHETLFGLKLGAWSEFMIYGLFVRVNQKYAGVVVEIANQNNLWLKTEAQRRNAREIIRGVFDDPAKRYLVLQADHHEVWPVSRFRDIIRAELARVAKPRAAPHEQPHGRPKFAHPPRGA
jgi:hypothetical protein